MIIGPPYDPIIPEIIPIMILYIILFPISFLLSSILIRKGRKFKIRTAIYLGSSFFCFGMGILIVFIGLLEVIQFQEFRELYRLSLPLAYSFGTIGNLILLFFGYELFGYHKRTAIFFILWGIIVLILINLDSNWYGVPNFVYNGKFSIRFISSSLMTIFSMIIYLYLIKKIRALTIEKPITKIGYNLIVWSLVFFLCFWLFMTADVIYINIIGSAYSFFTFIAWIFALFFWIFSYTGLIMPKKIRSWIEIKYPDN